MQANANTQARWAATGDKRVTWWCKISERRLLRQPFCLFVNIRVWYQGAHQHMSVWEPAA